MQPERQDTTDLGESLALNYASKYGLSYLRVVGNTVLFETNGGHSVYRSHLVEVPMWQLTEHTEPRDGLPGHTYEDLLWPT